MAENYFDQFDDAEAAPVTAPPPPSANFFDQFDQDEVPVSPANQTVIPKTSPAAPDPLQQELLDSTSLSTARRSAAQRTKAEAQNPRLETTTERADKASFGGAMTHAFGPQNLEALAGTMEHVAEMTGDAYWSKTAAEIRKSLAQDKTSYKAVYDSFSQIRGLADAWGYTKERAGQMVGVMAPSILGSVALGTVGAIEGGTYGGGGWGATIGGGIGALTGSLAGSIHFHVNDMREALKREGVTGENLTYYTNYGAGALALLDVAFPALQAAKIGGFARKALSEKVASQLAQKLAEGGKLTSVAEFVKHAGKGLARDVLVWEVPTELAQEAVSDFGSKMAAGKKITPADLEKFATETAPEVFLSTLIGAGFVGVPGSVVQAGRTMTDAKAGAAKSPEVTTSTGDKVDPETLPLPETLDGTPAADAIAAQQPAPAGLGAEPAEKKASSLLDFIRSKGGLQPSEELAALDAARTPGLVNTNGLTADEMREALIEEGFLEETPTDQPSVTSPADVYDLLGRAMAGERIVPAAERGEDTTYYRNRETLDNHEEILRAEKLFVEPALAQYAEELGSPIITQTFKKLSDADRIRVIDEARKGGDVADIIEQIAIEQTMLGGGDPQVLMEMIAARGPDPVMVERLRAMLAEQQPQMLGRFDEAIGAMPVRAQRQRIQAPATAEDQQSNQSLQTQLQNAKTDQELRAALDGTVMTAPVWRGVAKALTGRSAPSGRAAREMIFQHYARARSGADPVLTANTPVSTVTEGAEGSAAQRERATARAEAHNALGNSYYENLSETLNRFSENEEARNAIADMDADVVELRAALSQGAPNIRELAQAVHDSASNASAVAGPRAGAVTKAAMQAVGRLAADERPSADLTPIEGQPNPDQTPTEPVAPPDMSQQFLQMLASTMPRAKWGQTLGLSDAELKPYIDKAIAEGLLERGANGVVRRATAGMEALTDAKAIEAELNETWERGTGEGWTEAGKAVADKLAVLPAKQALEIAEKFLGYKMPNREKVSRAAIAGAVVRRFAAVAKIAERAKAAGAQAAGFIFPGVIGGEQVALTEAAALEQQAMQRVAEQAVEAILPAAVKIIVQQNIELAQIAHGDQLLALREADTDIAGDGTDGGSDGQVVEGRAAAGGEGRQPGARGSEAGRAADAGQSIPAGRGRGDAGLGNPSVQRIVRAESASLRADGSVFAGRPTKGPRTPAGRANASAQPVGKALKFITGIDGYKGRVLADAIELGDVREGNLARLVYEIFPDGLRVDEFTPSDAKMELVQRADGAWEIESVNVETPRMGLGTKLYNAVEKDLGVRLSPSGVLSDEGLAFWKKRSPESVKWHQTTPTWPGFNFSPRKIKSEIDRVGRELTAVTNDSGNAARIPEKERGKLVAKYRRERGQLITMWAKLPAEARLATDSMFAIRAFHGSPHDFDRFSMDKIGTGEGAQVFGHGLYFAEAEAVGQSYRISLSDSIRVNGEDIAGDSDLHYAATTKLLGKNLFGQTFDDLMRGAEKMLADAKAAPQVKDNDPLAPYAGGVERMRARRLQNIANAEEYLAKMKTVEEGDVQSSGNLYEVEIDVEPEHLLDWDAKLDEQAPEIAAAVRALLPSNLAEPEIREVADGFQIFIGDEPASAPYSRRVDAEKRLASGVRTSPMDDVGPMTGARAYNELENLYGSRDEVSKKLREVGIPGLRYLDQGSRDAAEGTRNIVVFDDELVKITGKNGKPVAGTERQQIVDQMFALRSNPSKPRTPTEVKVYHGTSRTDRFTHGRGDLYLTESAQLASDYAETGMVPPGHRLPPGAKVFPSFVETKDFKAVDMTGYVWESDMGDRLDAEIQAAKAGGHPGLIAKGMTDGGGFNAHDIGTQYIAWGEGTVRSALSENQMFSLRDSRPNLSALGQTDPHALQISIALDAVAAEAARTGKSKAAVTRHTARHEVLEFYRGIGLITEPEWTALTRAAIAENWIDETGVRAPYTKLYGKAMSAGELENVILKEAIAEKFAAFDAGTYQAQGLVAKVMQRVAAFVRATAEKLTGMGFSKWEDVFQKIEAGDLKRRYEQIYGTAADGRDSLSARLLSSARQFFAKSKRERAYHGTATQFDQFDLSRSGQFYFTSSEKAAAEYAARTPPDDWYQEMYAEADRLGIWGQKSGYDNVERLNAFREEKYKEFNKQSHVIPVDIAINSLQAVDLTGYSWTDDNGAQLTKLVERAKSQGKAGLRVKGMIEGTEAATAQDVTYIVWGGNEVQSAETGKPMLSAPRTSALGAAPSVQPIVRAGQAPDARGFINTSGPVGVELQGVHQIIDTMRRALGMSALRPMAVRTGRLNQALSRAAGRAGGQLLGQYNGVVRNRVARDIDTTSHEAGHHMERLYGADLQTVMALHQAELLPIGSPGNPLSEGFAEFFRRYITNPPAARQLAPGFYRDFEDFLQSHSHASRQMLDNLTAIQRSYEQLVTGDPIEQGIANQTVLRRSPGTIGEFFEDAEAQGYGSTMNDRMHSLYTAVVASHHGWWMGQRELLNDIERLTGQRISLAGADSPAKLIRMTAHTAGWAQRALKDGVALRSRPNGGGPSLHAALIAAFGNSDAGHWNERAFAEFGEYLVARRAVHEYVRWRPGLRSAVQAAVAATPSMGYLLHRLPGANATPLESRPTKEPIAHQLIKIRDFEQRSPQFRRAAEIYYAFNRDMIHFLYEKQFITREERNEYLEDKDYTPFQRDMSDRESATGQDSTSKRPGRARDKLNKYDVFRRFMGSDRDILNPLQSTIQFVYETHLRAAINDTMLAMDRLSRAAGPAGNEIFERLPATEGRGQQVHIGEVLRTAGRNAGASPQDVNTMLNNVQHYLGGDMVAHIFTQGQAAERGEKIVWFFENGKPVPAQLPDGDFGRMMYEGLTAMGQRNSEVLVKVLATPANVLRAGVTLSPAYVLRNLIVDSIESAVNSPYAIPGWTQARGLWQVMSGGEEMQLYNRYAGMMGGELIQSISDQSIERDVNALRERGFTIHRPRNIRDFLRMALRTLGGLTLGEATETATRVGIFQAARASALADGLSPQRAAIEAAHYAHDVIDFSRHGSKTEALRRTIPFWNAAVQGMDRYIRSLRAANDYGTGPIDLFMRYRAGQPISQNERRALGHAAKAWAATVFLLGGMSLIQAYLNDDDDDIDDVPDQIRATHWVISMNDALYLLPKSAKSFMDFSEDSNLRIPKPFQTAWIANTFERSIEYFRKNDPTAFNRLAGDFWEILLPPDNIQGLDLLYGWMSGKDIQSGRDIIPKFEEEGERADQFGPYTTETARRIGKALNVSPYYIDFIVRGTLASVGRDATWAIDQFSGRGPQPGIENYPIASRFTHNPARASRSLTTFYDQLHGKEGMKAWFWDTVSSDARSFTAGAMAYKKRKDGGLDAEASDLYERLNPDQKTFATLSVDFGGNKARLRNLHPILNAQEGTSVINAMVKDVVEGKLKMGKDKDIRQLTRSEMRTAREELRHIQRGMAQNALKILGTPGWAQQPLMAVDKRIDVLKAISPEIHKEMMRRLEVKDVQDFSHLAKVWPRVKDELLARRDRAQLGQYASGGKMLAQ